jgi:outer membrane protein OmpA-like peptidoglycan-associated protein
MVVCRRQAELGFGLVGLGSRDCRERPAECLFVNSYVASSEVSTFESSYPGELTMRCSTQILFCAALLVGAPAAQAEDTSTANPAPSAPSSLVLHFDPGSATVRQQDVPLLDQASRLYRAGNPIVMVVTGSADTVGAAAANLRLSQLRANNVLQGLVSRGIPVERFQVIAKGQTDPVVPTPPETSEERNRRVEITWR